MKQLTLLVATLCCAATAGAQETYDNANLATQDLNGTARYVGMGGAMDALGADISTIGTNPAGIGLFRRSAANLSFGLVNQAEGEDFADAHKTNMSFDQAGFVYARRVGQGSFFNMAFNYHKSRNFDYILSASDALSGASQNKLSYMKGAEGLFDVYEGNRGEMLSNSQCYSVVDYLYFNGLLQGEDGNFYYNNASGYLFNRAQTGYIGEYEFNLSGNINDRVYLGLTFGVSDVHYNGYSVYREQLVNSAGATSGEALLEDDRHISGTGFNLKAGVIFRPVEDSPFRVGLSVATPTWYDLTTRNDTRLASQVASTTGGMLQSNQRISEEYDFKLYTPWKFGFSLGTTIGDYLALGAVYEYADYGSLDSRINLGGGYDYWGDEYWDNSTSDDAMNRHTKRTLSGVSTVKLGMELRPDSHMAFRLGYNYVSPMYEESGYKDVTLDSPGTYYTSQSDYTNWKATNRITCGFGYTFDNFTVDMAYQYSVQSGDFSPFTSYYASEADGAAANCICDAVKVDNKRHQLLLTLGYRF